MEVVKEFVGKIMNNSVFAAVKNAVMKGDEVVLTLLIDAAISKIRKSPMGKGLETPDVSERLV